MPDQTRHINQLPNPPKGDPKHNHWRCDCPLDDMPCVCDDRQEYEAQSGPMCRNCWGHIGPRTKVHVETLIGEVDGIRITSGHYEPVTSLEASEQ